MYLVLEKKDTLFLKLLESARIYDNFKFLYLFYILTPVGKILTHKLILPPGRTFPVVS